MKHHRVQPGSDSSITGASFMIMRTMVTDEIPDSEYIAQVSLRISGSW